MTTFEPDRRSPAAPEPARALLRHVLATLAYRGGRAVRNASTGFADLRAEPSLRTPVEILAHVGQITLLRRIAGAPVHGESYFKADIAAGRLGPEPESARRELE